MLNTSTYYFWNRIGSVMISVLASSAVDRGFHPDRVKSKTIKLALVLLC